MVLQVPYPKNLQFNLRLRQGEKYKQEMSVIKYIYIYCTEVLYL